MPFNVELLSRSTDSIYPDTALIKDSIIVYNPERKRKLRVDVSKYHIQIPANGFFAVFQALSPSYYSKQTIWYKKYEHYKIPGLNMHLNKRDDFDGGCCDVDWPADRKGFYCLLAGGRSKWKDFIKRDQWIVYADGINYAISANITPGQ